MAGGIFGYYQWRKSILLGRAEYINELTEKIRTDKYIKDVIYMFDYNYKYRQSISLEIYVAMILGQI